MRWRFVDRVCSFVPWESIGVLKAGSLEEYQLLERWGEDGLAPASLLLETWVQAARWLVEASSAFTATCDFEEAASCRCPEGLRPGERYSLLLTVVERQEARLRYAVRHKRLQALEALPAAEYWQTAEQVGTFTVTLSPLGERYAPLDRECLWRELTA